MSAIAFEMVGDWSKELKVPLQSALEASIELTGKSGRDGAKRAMILMAASASALTPRAKKNRKIHRDKSGRYVNRWTKAKRGHYKFYDFMLNNPGYPEFAQITNWDQAKRISGRGLAKRSWMWGLKGIKKSPSKPIEGVGTLEEVIGDTVSGFVSTNRLKYVRKIMPGGWEKTVAERASNRIMAQVAKKIEKQFAVEVPRLAAQRRRKSRRLSQAWRKAK